MRKRLLCLALLAFLPATVAQVQPATLPEMGSSAGRLITPAEQEQYGTMLVNELRRQQLLIEDPLIDGWLQHVGYRLASASDDPEQSFTFFMMRDRRINAFATLGGRVGMNAGLVITAEREDEVAGVLAHEISHVTQKHVLRGAERQQQNQLPILLATLAAVAAASQSSSASSDDAIQAAVVGGQALMYQLMINYTRSNEAEADRIGIQTLHRAGYDPLGIADFFGRMERNNRGNSGGWQAPEYLRTHPVTTTRVSEARDRARQLPPLIAAPTGLSAQRNPLLPNLGLNRDAPPALPTFAFARERLRVLSARDATEAVGEYEAMRSRGELSDAQRYGLALALTAAGRTSQAERELERLRQVATVPPLWLRLADAELAHRSQQHALADERFEALLAEFPKHRAVVLAYADALIARGSASAGRRAQNVLRPLLNEHSADLQLQQVFGRASELAGDIARAAEAHAEAAFLAGRAEDALKQMEMLKNREDIDYVQRARVEARMAEIMPTVLELRRLGYEPEDQARQPRGG